MTIIVLKTFHGLKVFRAFGRKVALEVLVANLTLKRHFVLNTLERLCDRRVALQNLIFLKLFSDNNNNKKNWTYFPQPSCDAVKHLCDSVKQRIWIIWIFAV